MSCFLFLNECEQMRFNILCITSSRTCSAWSSRSALCFLAMAPKAKAKSAPKDTLPTELVKKLCSTLRYHQEEPGMKDLHEAYKSGDHAKKREILQKFLQDKSLKWRFDVIESHTLLHKESSETQQQWKTAAATAASEGLKPEVEADQQKLNILLEDMEVRDHPNAKLSAMGVKQYKEKIELMKTSDGQESSTAFVGTVTGKLVPKSGEAPGSSSDTRKKAAKRSAAEAVVDVNWATVMKQQKTGGRKSVAAAARICRVAHKHRQACLSERRDELTQAMRMVQDAEWAMRDAMKNLEDSEEDCQKLQDMVTNMNGSVAIFETLLYELVPDCTPEVQSTDEIKIEKGDEENTENK